MTIKTDIQLAQDMLDAYFSATASKTITADVVRSICALIERLRHHSGEIVESGTDYEYMGNLMHYYKLLLAEVWPSVQYYADDPQIAAFRALYLYRIDDILEYLEEY